MISGGSVGQASCQARACRHASSSTHWPIGTIRPVSSAIGMNWIGEITPRSGWSQRSSASTSRIRPVSSVMIGW